MHLFHREHHELIKTNYLDLLGYAFCIWPSVSHKRILAGLSYGVATDLKFADEPGQYGLFGAHLATIIAHKRPD
jgi:hypothetical protein